MRQRGACPEWLSLTLVVLNHPLAQEVGVDFYPQAWPLRHGDETFPIYNKRLVEHGKARLIVADRRVVEQFEIRAVGP